MTPERTPFSVGVIVLGGGALMLAFLLLVGFLLPADWEAEAVALLPASPEAVFAHLDSPEGWRRWTPWPDSGLVREGSERGPGAALRWDDPELGAGVFRIQETRPPSHVAYTVEVGDGAMRTDGSFDLSAQGDSVRVAWREAGDLGRNPIMGWWALFMGRAQSAELEKGLERLGGVVAAADSTPTGAR